ncbi:MAG: sulfur carrier protein ThiS [Acidobacteriota bacterium]
MKVYLNGESKDIPDGLNLAQLLEHFELPSQRVAVELNKAVVRRADWAAVTIADSDTIEVIHFVGGG